ncbi:hypothetical protein [Alteraurantiacibacter aquimixticola]|uniref:Uncharacterized protein n=1 Tax=Alteraurantiacibacter aquimixticola TaxID=2489173 RepID=A0A4T3EYT9_9SPHN|nr:hypothetical protein [Alteraurantiacibacter aquimixticola]TIX49691.1 hypothetical protein E5222_12815 [Alteraurantiacibacter aquimixticola]
MRAAQLAGCSLAACSALTACAMADRIPDPMTVNGHVLGKAEDFATRGPATVCMEGMRVTVAEGETAYLEYLGIHNGRLRLVLANDSALILAHGDSWADLRRDGQQPSFHHQNAVYFQIDSTSDYQIFLTTEDGALHRSPVLNLHGSALKGTGEDVEAVERVTFGQPDWNGCDKRFGYGWDGIVYSVDEE